MNEAEKKLNEALRLLHVSKKREHIRTDANTKAIDDVIEGNNLRITQLCKEVIKCLK